MKILIIYISTKTKNTEKVVNVFLKNKKVDTLPINKITQKTIDQYDIIGFGSGIFYSKHHKLLLSFIEKLEKQKNKKTFIFSTSGMPFIKIIYDCHKDLRKKLKRKNFRIISELNIRAFDNWKPLQIIGGLNKNRPNKKDLYKAKEFIEKINT